MKKIRVIKTVFSLLFLILLGLFLLLNIRTFWSISKQKLQEMDSAQTENVFSDIENDFRENITYRNKLVDMFGIYNKMIGHDIVGNFEFVADEQGVLHSINNYSVRDEDGFIQEIKELKAVSDERNIPVLYVQAPNREIHNTENAIKDFNSDDEIMDRVVNALQENDIAVLDLRQKLLEEDLSFELSDVFFHTDLHMQTDAEIWMANEISEYLETYLNVSLENEKYLDMVNYTKKSYPFSGNYGRTYGTKFVELDTFDMYFPNFETSFNYINPNNEADNKSGEFENILMNGYTNFPEIDEYTYFVLNYMHFMQPYYTYVNNYQSPDGLKLLVITDSIAYRGLSYLSLATEQITILDPRWFGGTDYLARALEENEFDSIIVLQGTYLLGNEIVMND